MGLITSLLPSASAETWMVEIDAPMGGLGNTNWDTVNQNSGAVFGGWIVASGAQNAQIYWDIYLTAGTWEIAAMHSKAGDFGIMTFSLDGTSVGTIDGYNGTYVVNQRSEITGVTVASSGKKRLAVTMATQNALATSFGMQLNHLTLRRTA